MTDQLRDRIAVSARHTEGEEPTEDATALLADAEVLIDRQADRIAAINRANLASRLADGRTLTQALADRDALRSRFQLLIGAADAAAGSGRGMGWLARTGRQELRTFATLDVTALRRRADEVAAQIRALDIAIERLNVTIELDELGWPHRTADGGRAGSCGPRPARRTHLSLVQSQPDSKSEPDGGRTMHPSAVIAHTCTPHGHRASPRVDHRTMDRCEGGFGAPAIVCPLARRRLLGCGQPLDASTSTPMIDDHLRQLHAGLTARPRPEVVAGTILRLLGTRLTRAERLVIGPVAASAEREWGNWSSMSEDWARPVGAAGAIAAALTALSGVVSAADLDALAAADGDDVRSVRASLSPAATALGWMPGPAWRDDATRERRDALGLTVSMRRFRRARRAVTWVAEKADRMERSGRRRDLALAGRTGMAGTFTVDRLAADPDVAAFVAYMAAKRNVRREFSVQDRANPFDEVAAVLLDRLDEGSDWAMVAAVHPTKAVLVRLSPGAQGELLGWYWSVMREGAALARTAFGPVDRADMIVRAGCDSDTLNLSAGAFANARAAWLKLLAATGSLDVLDVTCPPKLPKVMAADLVWYRRSLGQDPIHPDVKVAALLPPAWEVLSGDEPCTRADVEGACRVEDVDPEASGWTAPRPPGARGVFTPTPELVHGIAVADPVLAELLRRGGAFSGGPVDPEVLEVLDHFRDPDHGPRG